MLMKRSILLSIFFLIATTFASVHEVEHLIHDDDSQCLVCHVNNNLTSADIIDKPELVDIISFEKIQPRNIVSNIHVEERNHKSRAPPSLS